MPTGLSVEPDILEPIAIVGAVDHHGDAVQSGLPAGRRAAIEDDRPRHILLELLVDLPGEALALLAIALHRLRIEQLLDILVAVLRVVALGAAGVILVEGLI